MLHLWGPIVSVDARSGTQLHEIEVEDTVVATLQFENGALGVFEASTAVYPGYARRVELTGTNGTVTLEHDQLVGLDLKTPDPRFPAPVVQPPDPSPVNAASPLVSDATPHRRVIEDFIEAIRTGGRPACDGPEGRRSVAVIDAIYASARTKGPVTIG
jgi:predicted dehydrogenase